MYSDRAKRNGAPWGFGTAAVKRATPGRNTAFETAVHRAAQHMTGALPAGAEVLSLGVTPDLVDIVYRRLPAGLRNTEVLRTLEEALAPRELAARGREFIGMGAYRVRGLEGASRHWQYAADISLALAVGKQQVRKAATGAVLESSWQERCGQETSRARTTGPTFNAGVTGGMMMAAQPGGTGTVGVAYKRETTKGRQRSRATDHTISHTYPAGTVEFEATAELSVTISYRKKQNPCSWWARGRAEREYFVDCHGWSSSDGQGANLAPNRMIFGDVPVRYTVPWDLAPHSPSIAWALDL
ncbi:hypothetical protein ABZ667_43375 [Streptomyces lavendulae]|uniref:hypothetical protein n=1 Tax=Streptomyces lavendulae TaxID=1914 RepID=UPI0033CE7F0C